MLEEFQRRPGQETGRRVTASDHEIDDQISKSVSAECLVLHLLSTTATPPSIRVSPSLPPQNFLRIRDVVRECICPRVEICTELGQITVFFLLCLWFLCLFLLLEFVEIDDPMRLAVQNVRELGDGTLPFEQLSTPAPIQLEFLSPERIEHSSDLLVLDLIERGREDRFIRLQVSHVRRRPKKRKKKNSDTN